jgi:hypothetical protein
VDGIPDLLPIPASPTNRRPGASRGAWWLDAQCGPLRRAIPLTRGADGPRG